MDPLSLAQYIYNKNSDMILYDGKSFLLFDEKYKLWREHHDNLELFAQNDIPSEYIYAVNKLSFRNNVLKELTKLCYDESKLELLDIQHHLLPIADGLVIDVLEGTIRDRVKKDYFTNSSDIRYLDDGDLSDAENYFRSLVSSDTEYQNMLRVLGELLFGQTFGIKGVVVAGGPASGRSTLCSILCDLVDACCIENLSRNVNRYSNHYIQDKRVAHKDLSEFKLTHMMQVSNGDSFYDNMMSTEKTIKFRTVIQADVKNIEKYDPNKCEIVVLSSVFEPNKDNHSYIKHIKENCRDQIFTLILNAVISISGDETDKTNGKTIEIDI